MYIEQVLNACDTLYPNPYTTQEKYFWCDELSELLTIKYNVQYMKSELSETDGKYLLPEGIYASMLDKVICGDKILKKQDFRDFGIVCADINGRCEIVIPGKESYSRVYAIYIMPYEKIRDIELEENISYGTDYFLIDKNCFRPGDILHIKAGETIYDDVFVMDCVIDEESGRIKVIVGGTVFEEISADSIITRKVMEETVCPPPYDNMYIDYLLGKICYYQNDFTSCNNHMSLFNSKLADYEKWLKSHPVVEYSNTKMKNWW